MSLFDCMTGFGMGMELGGFVSIVKFETAVDAQLICTLRGIVTIPCKS